MIIRLNSVSHGEKLNKIIEEIIKSLIEILNFNKLEIIDATSIDFTRHTALDTLFPKSPNALGTEPVSKNVCLKAECSAEKSCFLQTKASSVDLMHNGWGVSVFLKQHRIVKQEQSDTSWAKEDMELPVAGCELGLKVLDPNKEDKKAWSGEVGYKKRITALKRK